MGLEGSMLNRPAIRLRLPEQHEVGAGALVGRTECRPNARRWLRQGGQGRVAS
jgi:hypothetical protein